MAIDPVSVAGAVVGLLGGLFKSKKQYHVYYWDGDAGTWVFVMNGIPSKIKATVTQLGAQGLIVQTVRNKNGNTAKPPTSPPAGWAAPEAVSEGTSKIPWILAGVAGLGLLGFVLLRRRR